MLVLKAEAGRQRRLTIRRPADDPMERIAGYAPFELESAGLVTAAFGS
jgi:hypothetical protein